MDTERDVFVVNLGGFDTHSDLIEDFSANMQVCSRSRPLFELSVMKTGCVTTSSFYCTQELNSCVASFVRELKRTPGLWENVAIATLSDFGPFP